MKPLLQSLLSKRLRFTLIEMVSAIGIMALIISITVVGVRFSFYINSDKKSRAVFKQLEIAFDQYFADYHCYPAVPSNYKVAGYVPLGLITWVTSTQTGEQYDADGNPIAGTTETTTGTSSVSWTYYTTIGQSYYRADGTPYVAIATKTSEITSFFRATLNRPPNNYNPYIEDALTPANVNNYTMDGFGQSIYYKAPGLINSSAYDLWSAGSDGYFGGFKDNTGIGNLEPLGVYGNETGTSCATSAKAQVHVSGGDPDDYVNWRKN